MSEATGGQAKAGPTLNESVAEVQGVFPGDKEMQDALSHLTLAGYDRADFSLPEDQPLAAASTPNQGADDPTTDQDKRQLRTLGTSMAGYAGSVAVAGATIATGGAAAIAMAAAAAVGVGTAAIANAGAQAADQAQIDDRNRRGREGTLVLAVRTRNKDQARQVMDLMQQAGASRVEPVVRNDQALTAGFSATGWTGS